MLKKMMGLGAAMALVGCGGGGGDSGGNTSTPSSPQCTATQYLEANVCKDKASQYIIGLGLPDMKLGEKATFGARASSGLTVMYSSRTPTICSMSGNQFTALKVGECTINANQAGDNKTLAAPEVSTVVLVYEPATQIITGLTLPPLEVGAKATLAATASSNLAVVYSSKTPTICTVSYDQVTATDQVIAIKVGECSIAANQAGDYSKILPAAEVVVKVTVAAPAIAGIKMTKTGITSCGNKFENNLPCTKAALGDLYGLGQDGEIQAGRKMSYTLLTQNGADCVRDDVTGLVWEQKTNDGGLRDTDWRYTWYSTNTVSNGGRVGSQDYRDYYKNYTQSTCGDSLTKCNTQAYIAALNAAKYCGYSDWRMPSVEELTSLVDFGRDPSINPIFTNIHDKNYWSALPVGLSNDSAWIVSFYNGHSGQNAKYKSDHVRAIRASQ